MIGFVPDGTPRSNEAIQHASGLWVAGHEFLERMDRTEHDYQGGVYATTAAVPRHRAPWGHIESDGVQAAAT